MLLISFHQVYTQDCTSTKEHYPRKGKETAQERASWIETAATGVQDCYWSQAGRSKNKGRKDNQKQWRIQARNEGTIKRNKHDNATDDGDVSKTSPTIVAHHFSLFLFQLFVYLYILFLNLFMFDLCASKQFMLLNINFFWTSLYCELWSHFVYFLTSFFSSHLFVFILLYFLLMTKGGVDV